MREMQYKAGDVVLYVTLYGQSLGVILKTMPPNYLIRTLNDEKIAISEQIVIRKATPDDVAAIIKKQVAVLHNLDTLFRQVENPANNN